MPSLYVLGLDISTAVTGASVVELTDEGTCFLIDYIDIDPRGEVKGEGFAACLRRLAFTRHALGAWLHALPCALDAVAFEDTRAAAFHARKMRGRITGDALTMALGAYLTLPALAGFDPLPITRASACAAVGCMSEYLAPAGKTDAERDAKRERLKKAVCKAASLRVQSALIWPENEGSADAAAVAVAAGEALRKAKVREASERRQPRLTGPRGGKL